MLPFGQPTRIQDVAQIVTHPTIECIGSMVEHLACGEQAEKEIQICWMLTAWPCRVELFAQELVAQIIFWTALCIRPLALQICPQ